MSLIGPAVKLLMMGFTAVNIVQKKFYVRVTILSLNMNVNMGNLLFGG
jgi:hypothetical protein